MSTGRSFKIKDGLILEAKGKTKGIKGQLRRVGNRAFKPKAGNRGKKLGYDAFQAYKKDLVGKGIAEIAEDGRVLVNGKYVTFNGWMEQNYDEISLEEYYQDDREEHGYDYEEDEDYRKFQYEMEYEDMLLEELDQEEQDEIEKMWYSNRRENELDEDYRWKTDRRRMADEEFEEAMEGYYDLSEDNRYHPEGNAKIKVHAIGEMNCDANRDYLRTFAYCKDKKLDIYYKNAALNGLTRGLPVVRWAIPKEHMSTIRQNLPIQCVLANKANELLTSKISSAEAHVYEAKGDKRKTAIIKKNNPKAYEKKIYIAPEHYQEIKMFCVNAIRHFNLGEEDSEAIVEQVLRKNAVVRPKTIADDEKTTMMQYWNIDEKTYEAIKKKKKQPESKAGTIVPEFTLKDKIYELNVGGKMVSCAVAVPGGFMVNTHAICEPGHTIGDKADYIEECVIMTDKRRYFVKPIEDARQFKTSSDLTFLRVPGVISTRRLHIAKVGTLPEPVIFYTLLDREGRVESITQNGMIRIGKTQGELETDITTEVGMCGGFYYTREGIVGIHFAGGVGENYALSLDHVKEEYEQMTDKVFL